MPASFSESINEFATRVLAVYFLTLLVGCRPESGSQVQTPTPKTAAVADSLVIETDHFTIQQPAGWELATTNTPATRVFLVSGQSENAPPHGMIKVDVGLPVDPDTRTIAEEMAKRGSNNAKFRRHFSTD